MSTADLAIEEVERHAGAVLGTDEMAIEPVGGRSLNQTWRLPAGPALA